LPIDLIAAFYGCTDHPPRQSTEACSRRRKELFELLYGDRAGPVSTDDLFHPGGFGNARRSAANPDGRDPSTGRSIELEVVEVNGIRAGKIAAISNHWDSATLMRQPRTNRLSAD
jgi:hypothetical protein